jgi:hypothetical protein
MGTIFASRAAESPMREAIIPVKLIREQHARPRRIRSLWMTFHPGTLIDVENNRERESAEWMPCRVHRVIDGQLWVIPVAR